MRAFIDYEFKNYVRSLTFIPPVTVFVAWVIVQYFYSGVPILSSYGNSAIVLYLVMAWMTMSIFRLEEESEKHLLFAHLKVKSKYLYGKWIVAFLWSVPLFLMAHFFPIVMGSFRGEMGLNHHILSTVSHLFLGMLGILVGSFFMATKLSRLKYVWLLSMLVLTLSLVYQKLNEVMANWFSWLLYILPPVRFMIEPLSHGDEVTFDLGEFLNMGLAVLYIILGLLLTRFLYLRNES